MGITCLNLKKFIDKPTKQYIAANIYEKPTANNVPKDQAKEQALLLILNLLFTNCIFFKIIFSKIS